MNEDRLKRWKHGRLPAPLANLDDQKRDAFDRLCSEFMGLGQYAGHTIDYSLPHPKHEFLQYLVEQKGYLLHGSRNTEIVQFEPKKANDLYEFSDQTAVYAASDGIWPIVFAIRKPAKVQVGFMNGCSRVVHDDGATGQPYYHFAMAAEGVRLQPWCTGTVYVLPRSSFHPHPVEDDGGITVTLEEWASFEPVIPVAQLPVSPQDFPFLDEFWGYDNEVLSGRYKYYEAPISWTDINREDAELFPIRAASAYRMD